MKVAVERGEEGGPRPRYDAGGRGGGSRGHSDRPSHDNRSAGGGYSDRGGGAGAYDRGGGGGGGVYSDRAGYGDRGGGYEERGGGYGAGGGYPDRGGDRGGGYGEGGYGDRGGYATRDGGDRREAPGGRAPPPAAYSERAGPSYGGGASYTGAAGYDRGAGVDDGYRDGGGGARYDYRGAPGAGYSDRPEYERAPAADRYAPAGYAGAGREAPGARSMDRYTPPPCLLSVHAAGIHACSYACGDWFSE